MAAGYTAAANIGELIPEITFEVQYVYQDKAIGPALVTFQDITDVPGTIGEFPRFTEVVGSTAVAETGTPTSHQMDLTMPTLTLERRSVYVIVSDLAVKGAKDDVVRKIAAAMAKAKAKQDDVQIFNVTGATTNYATSAGATNAALSISHALDALNLLELNEVDERIRCVVHPFQYKTIRSALTPVANDDGVAVEIASEMAREALVSRAFGMDWFVTNRVSKKTVDVTSNVYSGKVFVESGIGYLHSWGVVADLETERDAEKASTKMIINYFDKAGIINGAGVCDLNSTSV